MHAGTRVRFVVVDTVNAATGEPHYSYPAGTITAIEDGALVLRADSTRLNVAAAGTMVRVPVAQIGFGDEFIGRKRHPVAGLVIGLAVGGLSGYIIGNQAVEKRRPKQVCTTSGSTQYCYTTTALVKERNVLGVLLVPIGAVTGTGIGFLIRTDRWRKIDVTSLKTHFAR